MSPTKNPQVGTIAWYVHAVDDEERSSLVIASRVLDLLGVRIDLVSCVVLI